MADTVDKLPPQDTECGYCDKPGEWDPEEEEEMPPVYYFHLNGDRGVFHRCCYDEMMKRGPCGGD